MSFFVFEDKDFDTPQSIVSKAAQNIRNKNSVSALRTSSTERNGDRSFTEYSLSQIFLGAGLQKPSTLNLSLQQASLEESFSAFIAGEGSGNVDSVTSSAGRALLPGGLANASYRDLNSAIDDAFGGVHPSNIDSVAGLPSSDFAPEEYISLGNGHIPNAALAPLANGEEFEELPGHRLWAPAADAFRALKAAATADGYRTRLVTDSYRTFDSQYWLYWDRNGDPNVGDVNRDGEENKVPNYLAARPGTSMHGWGIAIDWHRDFLDYKPRVEPHVQKTSEHGLDWLGKNAYKYGFVHPTWARPGGSNPERWHWEYRAHVPGAV